MVFFKEWDFDNLIQYENNHANSTESNPELSIVQHAHDSIPDNQAAEENDEENMTLEERLWVRLYKT